LRPQLPDKDQEQKESHTRHSELGAVANNSSPNRLWCQLGLYLRPPGNAGWFGRKTFSGRQQQVVGRLVFQHLTLAGRAVNQVAFEFGPLGGIKPPFKIGKSHFRVNMSNHGRLRS
jgi:hypothetical protein